MGKLTLEIHHNERGWLEAAEINFKTRTAVELAYDLDYADEFERRTDRYALSNHFPVSFEPYKGSIPGFILDLIPQGEPLKRLLARLGIKHDDHYEEILRRAPLSSPGNIRIKEAWIDIEKQRPSYRHQGFSRSDIIQYQSDFTEYMEKLGAPIGGTSGAGGGSPKFLLREDNQGCFHAEGMLDDSETQCAWLIKFPYTDSQNSQLLSLVEKTYYDVIRELPLNFGEAIEIHDHVLFIKRFDRQRIQSQLCYHGLESFYGAHNISVHGSLLQHEDNLKLIQKYSTDPTADMLEYWKRDLLNQLLANPDNHGRNSSFIKKEKSVRLSPLYDVTAMKFFKSEPIVRLTRWADKLGTPLAQMDWMNQNLNIDRTVLVSSLRDFFEAMGDLQQLLKKHGVPREIISGAKADRDACLAAMKAAIE